MSQTRNEQAVIFGAGKIGRGFLAEILQDANYHLNFVEYDMDLVADLKQASKYSIAKVTNDQSDKVWITDYDVYHSDDEQAITELIATPGTIVGLAIHQDAIPTVASTLAKAISDKARASSGSTLDVILCINMAHPAAYMRTLLTQALPRCFHQYLDNNVGLVDSVVMRICPQATAAMIAEDPLVVLTNGFPEMPVDEQAFRGAVPDTAMFRRSRNIQAEEARKIYTLNMSHAVLAYLGTPNNHQTAVEAMADPDIRPYVLGALAEVAQALVAEFGFSKDEMCAWNEETVRTLDNRALQDPLHRLGYDTSRKLHPSDRLVGPALLCRRHGIFPKNLARAIAHGLAFDQPDDPGTAKLQTKLRTLGIARTLTEACGIDEKLLQSAIIEIYEKL